MSFEYLLQQTLQKVEEEKANLNNEKRKQLFTRVDDVINRCIKIDDIRELLLDSIKIHGEIPMNVPCVDILLFRPTTPIELSSTVKPRLGYMKDLDSKILKYHLDTERYFDDLNSSLNIKTIEEYANLDEVVEHIETKLNTQKWDIGNYEFCVARTYKSYEKCDVIEISVYRVKE